MNYTKGKWKTDYRKHEDGTYSQEVFDSKGETIATIAWHEVYEGGGVISTDREANAHLIAAAPEMYEALKEADMIICDLCKILNPQHKSMDYGIGCTTCKDREQRLKVIAKAEGKNEHTKSIS